MKIEMQGKCEFINKYNLVMILTCFCSKTNQMNLEEQQEDQLLTTKKHLNK